MRWPGHVARIRDSRGAYSILVGRPKETIPLGWPRRRLENNIKMDLHEIIWEGMGWIELVEDTDRWRALVNPVINILIP
jgi:hypothetical protein